MGLPSSGWVYNRPFDMVGYVNWSDFELTFRTTETPLSAGFLGSMIRGSFGHAFKKLVCVMRGRPCEGCPLEFACLYTKVFETRPDPNSKIMQNYTRVPHPFLLVVDFKPERTSIKEFSVGLRLFGKSIEASPFVLRAFEEAAERGFGSAKIPFKLVNIKTAGESNWQSGQPFPTAVIRDNPPAGEAVISWELSTPTRLTVAGKPLSPEKVDAASIVMPLLRRYGLMTGFHGQDNAQPDFKALKESSKGLKTVDANLHWQSLLRRSSRQKATQSISGLMGSVSIDTSDAPEWRKILDWAPIVHLGKNTTMGLGRVAAL